MTSGHVSGVTEAANLLHGEERYVQGGAGYQGLELSPEMPTENPPTCLIAMRPGKLANNP